MRINRVRVLVVFGVASILTACAGVSANPVTANSTSPPTVEASRQTDASTMPHRVVVGTKADQFGTGYLDVATYNNSGIDIDLAKYISGKLFGDDDPYILPVSSESRERALNDGVIEFFAATYTILPDRQAKFYIAGPYLVTTQGVMIGPRSPRIDTLGNLSGKRVCVVGKSPDGKGSDSARVLTKNVPNAIPVEDTSYSACLKSLRDGNVDAFSTDLAILYGYLRNNPDMRVIKDAKIGNPIFYGVAFRKDTRSKPLCMKAAEAIKELVKTKLWDSYFDTNLPAYKADFPEYQTQIQPTNTQIDDNSCK